MKKSSNRVRKIDWKSANLIIKYLYFFSILILCSLTFSSCDPCCCSNDNPKRQNIIFFSTLPINTSEPVIYSMKPDGSSFNAVIQNGILYSAPSKQMLTFLREKPQNQFVILVALDDGSKQKQIIPDNYFKQIKSPVLSPDTIWVAFSDGDRKLNLARTDGNVGTPITNNFCRNSIPAFSPNGKWIAFYEGQNVKGPLTIKVFNTEVPEDNIIAFQKKYHYGINIKKVDANIEWSSDGNFILYSFQESDSVDLVYYTNVFTAEENIYKINDLGVIEPVLAPDNSKFAFISKDGNIWIRNLSHTNPGYYKLTNVDSLSYNLFPQWSNDGKYLIYTQYFTDDTRDFKGVLKIIDVETRSSSVLCNNVYKAFWSK